MELPPPLLDPKITGALESLFDLGQAACDAIRDIQPDLVIGLAHSGWMPVPVARALWQAAESQPFPPYVRINLGLEKSGIYRDLRRSAGLEDFNAIYQNDFCLAPLLVWAEDQLGWQVELREMVAETIGPNRAPQHILVLDEMVSQGDTYLMTLSLLRTVYPEAEARFLAVRTTWTGELADLWLADTQPGLDRAALMKDDPRGMRKEGLKRIVVGTEDVAVNSLRWQFVTGAHPGLQSLSEVIPMSDLLACREWVEARVCLYTVQRAQGILPEPPGKKDLPWHAPVFWDIRPDMPAYRQLWQEGRITVRRWAEIRGCTMETAEQEIDELWKSDEYLLPRSASQPECYLPFLRSHFDAPDFIHPLLDVYWAIPGRLLAGPSPAVRDNTLDAQGNIQCQIPERLTWLAETGVTRILDLTEAADNLPRYDQHLNGGGMQIHICPLERFQAPNVARIWQLLDLLQSWLEDDETVYLCDLNGAERAGMVLACLLIERGMTVQEALAEINRLRFETQKTPALRCPESQEQWSQAIGWEKR